MADEKKLERGWSPSDIIAGAPVAAGIGVAGRRFIKSIPTAMDMATSSELAAGENGRLLREVSKYSDMAPAGAEELSRFATYAAETTVGQEETLFAWQKAASLLPENVASSINPASYTSPNDAIYSVFKNELPNIDIQYRNKFMRGFKANINLVKSQKELLGDKFNLSSLKTVVPTIESSYVHKRIKGLPGPLQPYGDRLKSMFGGLSIEERTLKHFQRQGLSEYTLKFNGLKLTIPRSVKGTILTGKDLSSRAAVGYFGIYDKTVPGLKRMSYSEYLMSRFENEVVTPLHAGTIGKREARGLIKNIESQMRKYHHYVPASSLEEMSKATEGDIFRQASTINLVTSEGRPLSVKQALRIPELKSMMGEKFFPSSSAGSMSKGTLSEIDQALISPISALHPQSRRPGHALTRVSYLGGSPIPGQANYSWLQSEWHKEMYGSEHARFAESIFLKDSELKSLNLKNHLIAKDGEVEVSHLLMAQSEGIRDNNWRLKEVNSSIADQFMNNGSIKQAAVIPAGTYLGISKEGLPLSASRDIWPTSLRKYGADKEDEFFTLFGSERLPYEPQQKSYYLKASEVVRPHTIMKTTQHNLGLERTPLMRMTADYLKKDPQIHATQMMGALYESLSRKSLPSSMGDFIKSPMSVYNRIASESVVNGSMDFMGFTKRLMQMGMAGGLNPTEFGRVFGGMSQYEGWSSKMGLGLSPEYLSAVENLSPVGPVMSTHGKILEETLSSHKPASIEPRIFDLLRGNQFGGAGADWTNELIQRAAHDNPQAVIASEEIAKSLRSFTEKVSASGSRFALKPVFSFEDFKEFIKTGGMLEIGGGRPDVYVPGMENLKQMIPYEMPDDLTRKEVFSDFAQKYVNLAKGAVEANANPLVAKEFFSQQLGERKLYEGAYWRTMQELQQAHAPFGKGLAGMFRKQTQRIAGSRTLKIASAIGSSTLPESGAIHRVGLADEKFMEMINSLSESGVDAKEISKLKQRFNADLPIGGLGWFHPLSGPYTVAPMQFVRVAGATGNEPLALMPERILNMPSVGKEINLSPVLAAARDKDGDNAYFMLLSGKSERQARNFWRTATPEQTQEYIEHMFQVNLLKPKAKAAAEEMSAITLKDLSSIAAEKLSMPEEYVGRLSVGLSEMRRSVLAMPENPSRQKALTAIHLLENVPISGKHVPAEQLAGDIASFEKSFFLLQDAMKKGNAKDMSYSFKKLLGLEKPVESMTENQRLMNSLIGSGIDITEKEASTIQQAMGASKPINRHIGGLNIEETFQHIAESQSRYKASGAAERALIDTGRRSIRIDEMKDYLARSAFKTEVKEGAGSLLSKAELIAKNLHIGKGGKAIEYLKPLAIGALGTMALAAMLSPPGDSVKGAISHTNTNYKNSIAMNRGHAAQNVTAESMDNPNPSGEVPARRISIPSARIGSEKGYNVNVRVNTDNGGIDPSAMGNDIRNMVGNTSQVYMNINDNRGTINHHEIMNDLD